MALSKQLQRIHEAIMTIKQYGGVFGRNPTFNDVTIEGQLTFDGDIDINSDLKVSGDIETTGNVIIATSGKGIDFSATAGTGTSELFSDYEEGNWALTDASGASLSLTVTAAYYTKIGRTVNFYLDVTYPSTADANPAYLTVPFGVAADGGGSIGYNTIAYATQLFVNVASSVQIVRLLTNTGATLTNADLSTKRFQITGQYIT
jgi:hypothetical protein